MGLTDREKATLEKLKKKERDAKKADRKRKKDFEASCIREFGHNPEEVARILAIQNEQSFCTDFRSKIADFYDLKSDEDFANWIEIMLNENSRRYWQNQREKQTQNFTQLHSATE